MSTRLQTQGKATPLSSFTPVRAGVLQRKCACGQHTIGGGECEECRKNRVEASLAGATSLQRQPTNQAERAAVPPIVYDVLRSPGQPLDAATRAFFEPRFGHDFGQVRVHTDSTAAESALAVNAVAYAVGRDIVFAAGQYQPNAAGGNQLLGHELTHVVQQHGHVPTTHQLRVSPCDDAYEREANQTSLNLTAGQEGAVPRVLGTGPLSVQRACGPPAIGRPTGCVGVSGDIVGEHFLFRVACDEFRPGEEAKLRAFAATLTSGGSVKIHGFASEEGDPSFNENLSCARAIKGKGVINSILVPSGLSVSYSLFAHGATAGNRADRRSITVDWLPAVPPACAPGPGIPNTVCSAYVANRWWLPLAYVDNATCACITTPNFPEYSCIRRFLQDRVAAAPAALKTLAASKKPLESSLNPLDVLEYKKFVLSTITPVIFKDHLDAYRTCCCPSGPAPRSTWDVVTTVPPLDCPTVGASILIAGTCHGTPGRW